MNGYLGNNVRSCVSGCFGGSKLYPPNLIEVGDGRPHCGFGQAKLQLAGVGFVFLGIPMYGHVALNSFLKFGQAGLIDWSR